MKRRNKKNEWTLLDAWNYLKGSRNYVYFSALMFLVFVILGFVFSGSLGFLDEVIKKLIQETSGLGTFELIIFIFKNNLSSAFFTLFLGVFLAIIPLFNVVVNGTLLGYVFSKVYLETGVSEFWRILPHGIFELPAIFIAIGLGFKLGMVLFSGNLKKDFKERLKGSALVFIFIILPLLIIAAIIEGTLIGVLK